MKVKMKIEIYLEDQETLNKSLFSKELARLKKENRDLKDAVEILKKAMSIVSSQ